MSVETGKLQPTKNAAVDFLFLISLQAELKLIGSGPDEATREKIANLESNLSKVQEELEQSTADAAEAVQAAEAAKVEAAKEKEDLAAKLQAAEATAAASASEVGGLKQTITEQAGEISRWKQKLVGARTRMQELSEFYWTKSGNSAIKKQLKDMGDDASRWTKPQQIERVVAPDIALLADE